MAFSYNDMEAVEGGFCSTAFFGTIFKAFRMPYFSVGVLTMVPMPRIMAEQPWGNLANVSSSTSGTSGTGGTTIVVGGSYTWIG